MSQPISVQDIAFILMRLVTTKAASKDSLQSVPFIVQYESRNNQVHFLGAKIGIFSESSKFFLQLL